MHTVSQATPNAPLNSINGIAFALLDPLTVVALLPIFLYNIFRGYRQSEHREEYSSWNP